MAFNLHVEGATKWVAIAISSCDVRDEKRSLSANIRGSAPRASCCGCVCFSLPSGCVCFSLPSKSSASLSLSFVTPSLYPLSLLFTPSLPLPLLVCSGQSCHWSLLRLLGWLLSIYLSIFLRAFLRFGCPPPRARRSKEPKRCPHPPC